MSQQTSKLIRRIAQGNRAAIDELLPVVYDELRAIAAQKLEHERVDIVALDDLMDRLFSLNEHHAPVFELRCFGGLDVKETASVLHISEATVKNDWRFARAWLASQIRADRSK